MSVLNVNGELADGECCDGSRSSQDLRCTRDECDTYFRVCLKEYQAEVATHSSCIFGSGSTQVLGGNMISFQGAKNKVDEGGRIVIPFQFAWLVSGASRPLCASPAGDGAEFGHFNVKCCCNPLFFSFFFNALMKNF